MDTATYQNIITQVDQFYDSAWTKLILYGGMLAAVTGIIFPIVFQHLIQINQKRIFRVRAKKIIENLKNDIDKIVEEKFRSKSEELNKELEKIKAHGLSGAFFLQGRAQIDEKDYTGSLLSYTRAARYFMICEDLTNLRSSLTAINNICLTNMTYKALIQLSRIKGTGLNKLLNDLENKEYGGAFSDLITKIKENIYRLKIAEEPPKQ